MNNSKSNLVKKFVTEWCSYSRPISDDTRLSEDIGLDGDDASEFMQEFASHFNVCLEGFDFFEYFGTEEAFNPFKYIYLLAFKRSPLDKKALTVGDLCHAARVGRWVDPRNPSHEPH